MATTLKTDAASTASGSSRHCVGRYAFTLPTDFSLSPESDLELVFGRGSDFRKTTLRAKATPGTNGVETVAAALVTKLSERPHSTSPTRTMLAKHSRTDDNSALVESYAVRGRLDFFKLDLVRQVGTRVVTFSTSVSDQEDPAKAKAELLRTAAGTRQGTEAEPPFTVACFSALQVQSGQDGEIYSLAFQSSRMRDVSLSISMNTMVAEPQASLLSRWDQKSGLLASLGGTGARTLRRGEVMLGGRPSEQLLLEGTESGHKVRQFVAETLLKSPSTPTAPMIAINLSMGGQVGELERVDASMTDAEALALWESILNSFQLRS